MRPNVTKAIVMSLILLAHTQVLAQGSTDTQEIVLEQQWEVGTDADSEVIFGVISG